MKSKYVYFAGLLAIGVSTGIEARACIRSGEVKQVTTLTLSDAPDHLLRLENEEKFSFRAGAYVVYDPTQFRLIQENDVVGRRTRQRLPYEALPSVDLGVLVGDHQRAAQIEGQYLVIKDVKTGRMTEFMVEHVPQPRTASPTAGCGIAL